MKQLALTLLALVLVACGGEPPPEHEPRQLSVRRTGEASEAPPEGILAPIDEWRANLSAQLPPTWKLAKVEQQVVAPGGWTRVRGPRGLAIELSDGAEVQRFWVMAKGFEGRATQADPALACGRNDEFVLYRPRTDAQGWRHTPEVVAALGLQ
ncbi:MAG: hypothetical protein AB7N76_06055 [Planctomycetota bacterium]